MCSQTYMVGTLPPDSTVPVGGGYPLVIFNPNMHVMCEEPGSCIFEGGNYQLANLGSNTLLDVFLALNGLNPLPDGYFVDSSNLTVEGFIFRGASNKGVLLPPGVSNVQLGGPGVNITIKDCLWTEQDTAYPPRAGVSLFNPGDLNITTGKGTLYLGLAVQNCTFTNNVFTYATIRVGDASNSSEPLLMALTIEDTVMEGNVITSVDCRCNASKTPSRNEFSAVVSVIHVQGSMANCMLKNNSMERARAAIVSVYSNFEVANDSVTFTDNSIVDAIGDGCTDVANVSKINGNWTDTCIGGDSASPDKSSGRSLSAFGVMVLGFAMTLIGTIY